MFTCDDEIGADATDLFNYLTGYSTREDYRKLLVAPVNLRRRFEEMLRSEINHARQGKKARLLFKMNSLVDKPMIRLLYEASQAGVQVDLIVRGICCLRPNVPGISENIRVYSVVGRFLEHSRIYYFYNGGQEIILMGSADLMPRNLNQRVEVLFPIEDPQMICHIRDDILEVYLNDNAKCRMMLPDGKYVHLRPSAGDAVLNTQEALIASVRATGEG
jgi:polyphosphate kinase